MKRAPIIAAVLGSLAAFWPVPALAQYGAPCPPAPAYPATGPSLYTGNSFSFTSPPSAYYPSYSYAPRYAPAYYPPYTYSSGYGGRVLPAPRYVQPGPYYYTPTYSYTPGYYSFYYTPGYFRY